MNIKVSMKEEAQVKRTNENEIYDILVNCEEHIRDRIKITGKKFKEKT